MAKKRHGVFVRSKQIERRLDELFVSFVKSFVRSREGLRSEIHARVEHRANTIMGKKVPKTDIC